MTVPRISPVVAAVVLAFSLVAQVSPAHADALQDASRLLKQGQASQALEQVNGYLSGKPKDAQGRFLKGLILTEMGRNGEAIAVFTRLTEDYPELPEPYNNLAVIYAQQKQYDKAKQALEMAIRTHPSYATAHENLGDLYARLASQAYDKALQLDSSNSSAQSKMALIRDLVSPGTRPSKPVKGDTEPAKTITPPPAQPTVIATAPAPAPVIPPPVIAPPNKPADLKPETKPVEAKPEVKPEPKVESKPEPKASAGDATSDVSKVLEAWAAAWSKKDVKAYLSKYAKDFKTPNGEPRAEWESERNKRISKPGKISVSIENIKVSQDNTDQVTVRFRQYYKSATLSSASSKLMVLVKRDGKWLIQQERIGS